MASFVTFTIVFGYAAVLCCLQLHLLGGGAAPADTMAMATATAAQAASQSGLARLAAAALVPAVVATLTLTPLLSFAHVYELVRARAAAGNGGAGDRLVAWLAKATLLAATAALLAGAVLQVQLGADGHLDRGRGDVARLNIK